MQNDRPTHPCTQAQSILKAISPQGADSKLRLSACYLMRLPSHFGIMADIRLWDITRGKRHDFSLFNRVSISYKNTSGCSYRKRHHLGQTGRSAGSPAVVYRQG
ncbi:hypothetical protein SOD_c08250 [Serratia plymuthica 4Rx13]|nr:hypothetical protein SOD_c08250 [Serratia plymuthica 4Rx13]